MAKVQSFSSYCWCVVVLHRSLTLNRHSVDRQAEVRDLNESTKTHIHQVCFTPSRVTFPSQSLPPGQKQEPTTLLTPK